MVSGLRPRVQPASGYFLELEQDAAVSDVVRPRASDLRVPVDTKRGVRHVWGTFSEDQIDLNYGNPYLLLEMVRILLFIFARGPTSCGWTLWRSFGKNWVRLVFTCLRPTRL